MKLKDFELGEKLKNTLDPGLPTYTILGHDEGITTMLSDDGLVSAWNSENKNFEVLDSE